MPDRAFTFETDCINAQGRDINDMRKGAAAITYGTMLRHCDILAWAIAHNYALRSTEAGHNLTLRNDWGVSYHKSFYRGLTCYFLVWSAIEYIWVDLHELADGLVCPKCSEALRPCFLKPKGSCLHCRNVCCWCGPPEDAHRKEVINDVTTDG